MSEDLTKQIESLKIDKAERLSSQATLNEQAIRAKQEQSQVQKELLAMNKEQQGIMGEGVRRIL